MAWVGDRLSPDKPLGTEPGTQAYSNRGLSHTHGLAVFAECLAE